MERIKLVAIGYAFVLGIGVGYSWCYKVTPPTEVVKEVIVEKVVEVYEQGGMESPIENVEQHSKFVFPVHPEDYVTISSPYGYRISPIVKVAKKHEGLDLTAVKYAQVLSIADGIVVDHYPPPGTRRSAGGVFRGHPVYGGMIEVRHRDSTTSLYAHLSATYVKIGQKVEGGQVIGRMGNTGITAGKTGNHLHLEMKIQDTTVNPLLYIAEPEAKL